jgi:hypothetical protein
LVGLTLTLIIFFDPAFLGTDFFTGAFLAYDFDFACGFALTIVVVTLISFFFPSALFASLRLF